jgi:hypothetical protein
MRPSLAKEYDRLRSGLLSLDGVSAGEKFGAEAFFFRRRFFCHVHRGNGFLLLETFVWKNVDKVVKSVPGAIPHPQYGGYGWVRFKVSSSSDLGKAKKLIEMSHNYVIRTKRISLPRTDETRRRLKSANARFPEIHFDAKDSPKRTQVIMEVQEAVGSVHSGELLNQAALFLRQS